MNIKIAEIHENQIDDLRRYIDPEYSVDRSEGRIQIKKLERRWFIDTVFLALISLACIWSFFARPL